MGYTSANKLVVGDSLTCNSSGNLIEDAQTAPVFPPRVVLLPAAIPGIILLRDVFVPPRLLNDLGKQRMVAVVVSNAPVHGQFRAFCL